MIITRKCNDPAHPHFCPVLAYTQRGSGRNRRVLRYYYIPSPSQPKNSANLWWNCCEECFKMFSSPWKDVGIQNSNLAQKRSWNIDDSYYGNSLGLLSLASSYSGEISLFSLAHSRWRSCPDQPAQAACPRSSYIQYRACALVDACAKVDNGRHAVAWYNAFHEGWGM